MEPMDQFYGDRSGGVLDQFGNQWWFGTRNEEISSEELASACARSGDSNCRDRLAEAPCQVAYRSVSGSRILKVVPLSLGLILMRPPCDSTIRPTMARPRPAPSGLLVLSREVNARSRDSASIPQPVSRNSDANMRRRSVALVY